MSGESFHLNLMKPGEVRSSSPVRLRVMMPLFAMLATVGMLVWWGMVLTQMMIIQSVADATEADNREKQRDHADAIKRQDAVREKRLQVEQLEFYRAGVRSVAAPLAKLAEDMPLRVQLTSLSILPPPPQPAPPTNKKAPPVWGPPTNVETQRFVVAGRATKATPVSALMESLDGPEFAALAGEAGDPATGRKGKVNSFRQDTNAAQDGTRLLTFELEYTMPERRFAKE